MPTLTAPPRPLLAPAETEAAPGWLFAVLAFASGLFAPFAVNLVGLLPVGELVFGASLVYLLLWMVLHHRTPGWLLRSPLLWTLLACQAVAFAGYMAADFYRGSATNDILRGWARMVFLAMDVLAVAFLFGGSPRKEQAPVSYVAFEWGYVAGMLGNALFGVVIFGDYWKFGYAFPVAISVLLLVPRLGFWPTQMACVALGALNMALSFRSMGAMCLMLPFGMILQRMLPKQRAVAMPVCAALALAAVGVFYTFHGGSEAGTGSTRSDVERAAMLQAAWNGFRQSPILGNGSWFSRSNVMDDFYYLRYSKSIETGVGTFSEGEEENVTPVIHSQILVGLAEGGILGGCFFLAYGIMLVWALAYCALQHTWHRLSAMYFFTLLESLFGLGMSPFSGMHRMLIAVATGLILMLWAERTENKRAARAPLS